MLPDDPSSTGNPDPTAEQIDAAPPKLAMAGAPSLTPSNGRVVWYRPGHGNSWLRRNDRPLAAIVVDHDTSTDGAYRIALVCFPNSSMAINRGHVAMHFANVELLPPGVEGDPTTGWANWMPYQAGQAAKTYESVEEVRGLRATIAALKSRVEEHQRALLDLHHRVVMGGDQKPGSPPRNPSDPPAGAARLERVDPPALTGAGAAAAYEAMIGCLDRVLRMSPLVDRTSAGIVHAIRHDETTRRHAFAGYDEADPAVAPGGLLDAALGSVERVHHVLQGLEQEGIVRQDGEGRWWYAHKD